MPDNDIDFEKYDKNDFTKHHLEGYIDEILRPTTSGSEIVNVQMCVTSFPKEMWIAEKFGNVTSEDIEQFRQKAKAFMNQPQNQKLYQDYFLDYPTWWESDEKDNQTK